MGRRPIRNSGLQQLISQSAAERSESTHLLRLQSCETKHANLVSDVLPTVGGALLLEVGDQLSPHANDAVGHAFYFLQPVKEKKKGKMQLNSGQALKREATAHSILTSRECCPSEP